MKKIMLACVLLSCDSQPRIERVHGLLPDELLDGSNVRGTPQEGDTLEGCQDGEDSDDDGWTDCEDQDCCIYMACVDAQVCGGGVPTPQEPRDAGPSIKAAPDAALTPDPDAEAPRPPEVCDGLDNDGDGQVDEGCSSARCGNGVIEDDEECDGSDLRGTDCDDLGQTYGGGTLLCQDNCRFDLRYCRLASQVEEQDPSASDGSPASLACFDGSDFCGASVAEEEWKTVSVKIWAFVSDAGTVVANTSELETRVDELNDRLGALMHVHFDLLGTEGMQAQFVDVCSNDCAGCPAGYTVDSDMFAAVHDEGILNVYIVGHAYHCGVNSWVGGWSSQSGTEDVGPIVVGEIFAHSFLQEVGHFFGLSHTFEDTLCDTPNDPGPCWYTSPPNTPPCCNAGGCMVSSCTPLSFAPLANNAMDYYGCDNPFFTVEQGAQARCFLDEHLTFLDTDEDPPPCTPIPEICDAIDQDCDGNISEGSCSLPNVASTTCASGFCLAESCNAGSGNCDGLSSNGCETALGTVTNCGGCGNVCPTRANASRTCSAGVCGFTCNTGYNNCDGSAANGCEVYGSCGGCTPSTEICNGVDDDCDGSVDEGVRNACGTCGTVPAEVCDGLDNDCDGSTDEGVRNVCGTCGAVPIEVCNGVDDDCDGVVDEGVRNACGGCGSVPSEACNGADDDCDGAVDDGLAQSCVNACGNSGIQWCTGGTWGSCSAAACPPPVVCGDSICNGTETCASCSRDCGGVCTPGASETGWCDDPSSYVSYCVFEQTRTCTSSCAWGAWTCAPDTAYNQYGNDLGTWCGDGSRSTCITLTSCSGGTCRGYFSSPTGDTFTSTDASWRVRGDDGTTLVEAIECGYYAGRSRVEFSFPASRLNLSGSSMYRGVRGTFWGGNDCVTNPAYTTGTTWVERCY